VSRTPVALQCVLWLALDSRGSPLWTNSIWVAQSDKAKPMPEMQVFIKQWLA
jgi:hypothetical protein